VKTVQVLLPSGSTTALKLQSDNKTFDFSDDSTTSTGLDATYPNGAYDFKLGFTNSTKTLRLVLPEDAYPDAPNLVKIPAGVDSATDLLVAWNPFNGGTSSDFVQLHVEDEQGNKVFETPNFSKSGALTGTAVGAIIPRNSLLPNQTYNARVVFQKNLQLDTQSYPGALGLVSYASRTSFVLTTVKPTDSPVSLNASLAAPDDFRLVVQAPNGSTIRVDASSDLRAWAPVSTNTVPAGGRLELFHSVRAMTHSTFFRAALTQ
jgi:hypothetical protein